MKDKSELDLFTNEEVISNATIIDMIHDWSYNLGYIYVFYIVSRPRTLVAMLGSPVPMLGSRQPCPSHWRSSSGPSTPNLGPQRLCSSPWCSPTYLHCSCATQGPSPQPDPSICAPLLTQQASQQNCPFFRDNNLKRKIAKNWSRGWVRSSMGWVRVWSSIGH